MSDEKEADLIYHNGPIITMDDGRPEVEAIAVAGGRIIATGQLDYVMRTRTDNSTVIDLEGKTLMPAFIDGHGHFANALQIVAWANVSIPPVGPVTSIPDVISALQELVGEQPVGPGDWIIGYGYDSSGLAEGRDITRDDLDPHFPDNPVMLIHNSNHGGVLNSAAFAVAGIDENTPTPPGGLIARKPGSNEPAGLLMETAFIPIFSGMPQPTTEELLGRFDGAQQIYASVGVTTMQEGATTARDFQLLRQGAGEGRLYLDLVVMPAINEVPALVRDYFPQPDESVLSVSDTLNEQFGHYDNRFKVGGIKFVLDGSPQGKTAFWSEPLLTPGPAGEANWRGAPLAPPELITAVFQQVVDHDIRVYAHCNGDAAIDMLLDACEAAGVKASDDRRDVVIHSQFMRPDQLDRYVEYGLTPSYFTVHAFFWGDIHIENLGQERAFFLSPMKSAAEKGIRFSNHNDYSVTPLDPMRMTWSAVTRQARSGTVIGPDERVSVWQALRALTIDAAWQYKEEDDKGSLEAGKLADLVILDANPLAVPVDDILTIGVVETLKEGVTVYRREAGE